MKTHIRCTLGSTKDEHSIVRGRHVEGTREGRVVWCQAHSVARLHGQVVMSRDGDDDDDDNEGNDNRDAAQDVDSSSSQDSREDAIEVITSSSRPSLPT